ncbi:ABC transporter permease [Methylogaea oryzae]|uniref:Transport permease protein n=1 Tax=Methylogaea oryzae TaxID=1295382 RepID=A0A8D5AKH4_9GAMM|nr:ABC transporter permease [Methylogaea oryzae]BBL71789.1 transport permease protein [Methylogaea oryzae]
MNTLIAFQTIVYKEVARFTRIWPQTILPAAVTTSLYFLIFGRLMGERIGDMGGYRYIDFIVPGVILMTVINNAYSNVVSSFYSTKFQRHIEELLVAPVPNWVILAGYVTGGVARGLAVGGVVTAISLCFTEVRIHDYGITLAVFLVTSALFALAGFINAVYANSFDDISIIPNFVLTPLVYLGGVFYTVDLLPEFWRNLSLGNPILYMVNAFRYGFLGISDIPLLHAFSIGLGFIAAQAVFALYLLNKGVGLKS